MLPTGFWKFLVHGVRELRCNKSSCAEIAHEVSSKNHKARLQIAGGKRCEALCELQAARPSQGHVKKKPQPFGVYCLRSLSPWRFS